MSHAIEFSAPIGDEVRTTTCYMCACRCGIRVHLKDGAVRYIEGNPEHPVNRGVLCAKGSAGIMQHYSPARLSRPLLRTGERGRGEFREISWEEAVGLAVEWLRPLREKDPRKLAFFTGRDQSQALTGWWASRFGTPNYAAHGGFCSVNMAAAGLYSIGASFWEFGEPDWEHTRWLMLFGVAEDHDSNPIKLGLAKLKARGARVVSVNPVRTGYSAIADEWIGITPGTDGRLILALVHELLRAGRVDARYLAAYTNAPWLVVEDPGGAEDGLFARDPEGRPLAWDREEGVPRPAPDPAVRPALRGRVTLPDGRAARPVFELLARRYLDPGYAPDAAAAVTGVSADTIRRLAAEMARIAFTETVTLDVPWTDAFGRRHETMTGRPVAFHAMRGISAHSNGFQTCRALHLLQMLLGAVDVPGGFRYKTPFPKPAPPPQLPAGRPDQVTAGQPMPGPPLGFPQGPEDLLVDDDGRPTRIDKAFSWEAPLAAHGMMHTVIRNAWAGDPYPIDTLFLYMANMAWNSAMNTAETAAMLTDRDPATGEYRIPRFIYSDAFASETVAYADLVLPDTTYLERWDCISLLDRPIGSADGPGDSIRQPVVAPDRDVRPFQDVLLEIGARLGLPGLVREDGTARYPGGYPDFLANHEYGRGSVRSRAGAARTGRPTGPGRPNPRQLDHYVANGCFWRDELAPAQRYFKHCKPRLPGVCEAHGLHRRGRSDSCSSSTASPCNASGSRRADMARYSRPASTGRGWSGTSTRSPCGTSRSGPRAKRRAGLVTRPRAGKGYRNASDGAREEDDWPLHAVTQRPMAMYHSWGSQRRLAPAASARATISTCLTRWHKSSGSRTTTGCSWRAGTDGCGRKSMRMRAVNERTVWTWTRSASVRARGISPRMPRKGCAASSSTTSSPSCSPSVRAATATRTRTRSPDRPPGTTSGCGSARRTARGSARRPLPSPPGVAPVRPRACSASASSSGARRNARSRGGGAPGRA